MDKVLESLSVSEPVRVLIGSGIIILATIVLGFLARLVLDVVPHHIAPTCVG